MNPTSGPGTAADVAYRSAISHCQGHGQDVIGYVFTDYGNRQMNQVKSDIDRYYSFYPRIRGIFLGR